MTTVHDGPTILYFCLYFLHDKQNFFDFEKARLHKYVAQFMSEKFNMTQIELPDLERLYPALESKNRNKLTNELGYKILSEALAFCGKTNEIIVRHEGFLNQLRDYCSMSNVKHVRSVGRFISVTSPFSLLRKRTTKDEFGVVTMYMSC